MLIGSGLRLRAGVFLVCHGLHAAAEEGGGEGALGKLLGEAGGGFVEGFPFVHLGGDVGEPFFDGFLGDLFRAAFGEGFDGAAEGFFGGGVVEGLGSAGHELAEGEADGAAGDGGACGFFVRLFRSAESCLTTQINDDLAFR